MDDKKIALTPAYQLAALTPGEQAMLLETIDSNGLNVVKASAFWRWLHYALSGLTQATRFTHGLDFDYGITNEVNIPPFAFCGPIDRDQ